MPHHPAQTRVADLVIIQFIPLTRHALENPSLAGCLKPFDAKVPIFRKGKIKRRIAVTPEFVLPMPKMLVLRYSPGRVVFGVQTDRSVKVDHSLPKLRTPAERHTRNLHVRVLLREFPDTPGKKAVERRAIR